MKKITIPSTITIMFENIEAGKISFKEFIRFLLDNDKRANDSGKNIRAALRIESAINKGNESEEIELEDNDFKLLASIVLEPECGYPVITMQIKGSGPMTKLISKQLLPFIEIFETESK